MVDIFIKSFNRPYYLDRCIVSIKQHIKGKYTIKVLDDGTPQKYLDKISERHPEIIMSKSKNYLAKTKAIEENIKTGKEINGFEIPTDLWISEAQKGSEYFIMTEDDVWFTKSINIEETIATIKEKNIHLLKLGWLGNTKDEENLIIENTNQNIQSTQPKSLFLSNKKVMEAFFLNRYKFFTILYKLGVVDNTTRRKYWALNSILMGLYKKEYWLEIWKDMRNKVDEKKQLINASVYYKHHKENKHFISKIREEIMKTTFQSSATNSYHKYGFDFDVNYFNHLMNEAWLNETLDPMQNYPKDFSQEYFEIFFDKKIKPKEFQKWINQFKNQYKNNGALVD